MDRSGRPASRSLGARKPLDANPSQAPPLTNAAKNPMSEDESALSCARPRNRGGFSILRGASMVSNQPASLAADSIAAHAALGVLAKALSSVQNRTAHKDIGGSLSDKRRAGEDPGRVTIKKPRTHLRERAA